MKQYYPNEKDLFIGKNINDTICTRITYIQETQKYWRRSICIYLYDIKEYIKLLPEIEDNIRIIGLTTKDKIIKDLILIDTDIADITKRKTRVYVRKAKRTIRTINGIDIVFWEFDFNHKVYLCPDGYTKLLYELNLET